MAYRAIDASPRRLETLQSLRGIAALIVLLRHAVLSYPISNVANGVTGVILNAHAAVVVFFVLSGFVLSMSLERRALTASSLAAFYLKRGFRILPPLILITIASIVYTHSRLASMPVPGASPFLASLLPHGPMSLKIVLLSLLGMNSHYLPQSWTLMVELLLAIVFPFAFFYMRGGKAPAAMLLVLATAASLVAPRGGHWLPVVYAVDFLIGVETFLLWSRASVRKPGRPTPPRLWWLIAATLPLITARPIAFAFTHQATDSGFHDAPTAFAEAIAGAWLILLIARGGASRVLSHRTLLFLGDISFSVYLIHFLVIAVAARLFATIGPSFDTLDGLVRNAMLAATTLAVSVGMAALLYRFIETPWTALGRYLAAFDWPDVRAPLDLSEANATAARE